jgi:inner membrane protein
MIHSFSFLLLLLILIFVSFREILVPFALGYALHLIADCFTVQGIRGFYPLKLKIRGKIRTGGIIEFFILIIFISGDLFLAFNRFFSIF